MTSSKRKVNSQESTNLEESTPRSIKNKYQRKRGKRAVLRNETEEHHPLEKIEDAEKISVASEDAEKIIDDVLRNINTEDDMLVDGSSIDSGQTSHEGSDSSMIRSAEESDDDSYSNVAVPDEIEETDEIEEIVDGGWRLVRPIEGGPTDISLLTSFRGHVAFQIWNNKDRGVLNCQTRTRILSSWKMRANKGWGAIVKEKGFSHLSGCMFNHLNTPLISAFVERWHPETNSFHMPFREISITLHDVAYLLNLKIVGAAVHDDKIDVKCKEEGKSVMDLMKESVSRCLDVPIANLKAPGVMKGCAIKLSTVKDLSCKLDYQRKARAYIFTLLGSFLFVDKSFDKANGFIMPLLEDLTNVSDYAWGTATLAYLYRQLGIASRSGVKGIGGCLGLLDAWIYEYFPKLAPRGNLNYSADMPRACKWIYEGAYPKGTIELKRFRGQLDRMKSHEVEWMPFGRDPHVKFPASLYEGVIQFLDVIESYMPQRFIRQYGFVQHIPENPFPPEKFSRPANGNYVVEHPVQLSLFLWKRHSTKPDTSKFRLASSLAEVIDGVVDGYLPWFERVSHMRVQNPTHCQLDPIESSSRNAKVERLKELIYSVQESRRPAEGYADVSIYHYIIDQIMELLPDLF